jgi:hypothetical protein
MAACEQPPRFAGSKVAGLRKRLVAVQQGGEFIDESHGEVAWTLRVRAWERSVDNTRGLAESTLQVCFE